MENEPVSFGECFEDMKWMKMMRVRIKLKVSRWLSGGEFTDGLRTVFTGQV